MTADRLSLERESIKEVNLSAVYQRYLDNYKPITIGGHKSVNP